MLVSDGSTTNEVGGRGGVVREARAAGETTAPHAPLNALCVPPPDLFPFL